MNRREKRMQLENDLLGRVYDLILNVETLEEERVKLIEFKNDVESGKDLERETMKLADELRRMAVSKIKDKTTLSKEVSEFYMYISTTGLFKRNLGIGLACMATFK